MAFQHSGVPIICSTFCLDTNRKSSTLRVTGLCEGNPPVTDVSPSQMPSDTENVSLDDVIMLDRA